MPQVSEISHDLTFIVISSVGVWSRTARSFEPQPVPEPEEVLEAPDPAALDPEAAGRRCVDPTFSHHDMLFSSFFMPFPFQKEAS